MTYNTSTKTVSITCYRVPHEVASSFTENIAALLYSHDLDFYGDVWKHNTRRRIISTESAGMCLVLLPLPLRANARAGVKLLINGRISNRRPDGSLRLKGDVYPFLVCEVVDTESNKELMHLAREYIVGTTGAVQFVILVKFEHDTGPPSAGPVGSQIDGTPMVSKIGYTRGLFWVYSYSIGPSPTKPAKNTGKIVCLEFQNVTPCSWLTTCIILS